MSLSPEAFKQKLFEKEYRYHIHHSFHVDMRDGKLTKEQLRGWVFNRFYYQMRIPQKDAAILSNCPDQNVRRRWISRIEDHDGKEGNEGGIEAWIRLGEACGLQRQDIVSCEHVLPGVRFAVDAYVNFARTSPWQEAVCSSLTELFAPQIHKQRLATWPKHYKWVEPEGLSYFQSRISLANRDVEHGLEIVLAHFRTDEQQQRALEILQFKLDILWHIADVIESKYGRG